MCFSCSRTLTWIDLIPVFSWIVLRGRCRTCKSPISIQYPLVEATTGITFALIAHVAPLVTVPALWILASILIVLATYDFLHTILPDVFVFLFIGAAFASHIFLDPPDITNVYYYLWALCAPLPLFTLWLISGGAWMGFGDVKLAFGIGLLLGDFFGVSSVMAGFVLGALFLTPLLLLGSSTGQRITHMLSISRSRIGLTMKSEVPFGPFLILACAIALYIQLSGAQWNPFLLW